MVKKIDTSSERHTEISDEDLDEELDDLDKLGNSVKLKNWDSVGVALDEKNRGNFK